MEKAEAAGNSQKLFKLIRNTGGQKTNVSETICDNRDNLIHSKEGRIKRWAEHFKDQFSWPVAREAALDVPLEPQWTVSIDPPTESEVRQCIQRVKQGKAAGSDALTPALFRYGGDSLVRVFT